MNPDDDDAVINQFKHPKFALEVLVPKVGGNFVRALHNRKIFDDTKSFTDLQVFAEDELVRKQYDELRCEMPGTPRSTFLMVFSPDGTKVASTHGNHNIYVTDLRSGKNIKTLVGHPRTPWCIAFHPTCNELVASGCLGGQVRIWDLSGGSEVWTAGSQTVIASIAFHPNDRILVIATYNELYFWDWSKPRPFTQSATCNAKEKVRYVTFDKLGHKLITGIANVPQSRWERTRSSTPSERIHTNTPASDRSTTQRANIRPFASMYRIAQATITNTNSDRVPLSSVPERERRITACYRNLVHEYELLVHRYLQVYRPTTTIDRGTDPMEMEQQSSVSASITTSSPIQSLVSISSAIESNFRMRQRACSTTSSNASTSRNNSQPSSFPRSIPSLQTSVESSIGSTSSSSNNVNKSAAMMKIRCSPRTGFVTNGGFAKYFTCKKRKSLKQKVIELKSKIEQREASVAASTPQCTQPVVSLSTSSMTSAACSQCSQVMQPAAANLSTSSTTLQNHSTSCITIQNIQNVNNPVISSITQNVNIGGTFSASTQNLQSAANSGTVPTTAQNLQNQSSFFTQNDNSISFTILTQTLDNNPNISSSSKQNIQNANNTVSSISGQNFVNINNADTFSTPTHNISNSSRLTAQNISNPSISITSTENLQNVDEPGTSSRLRQNANNNDHWRMQLKRFHSDILKKCNKHNRYFTIGSSSDNSSSDEDNVVKKRLYSSYPNSSTTTTTANEQTAPESHSCVASTSNATECCRQGTVCLKSILSQRSNVEKIVNLSELVANGYDNSRPNSSIQPNNSSNSVQSQQKLTTNSENNTSSTAANIQITASANVTTNGNSEDANQTEVRTSQSPPCASSLMNTITPTTNSTVYTPSSGPRRRFFSHVLSAFLPTRISNVSPNVRNRHTYGELSRSALNPGTRASTRMNINFAPDEVINYAERVNSEYEDFTEQPSNLGEFHPFDPPPEIPSINPENIGIGNMYSNIVQDLESSLNNVRNIRASNRPGETSDMLSSFSERLESIMHQSNSILYNLRHTMDMLPPNSEANETNTFSTNPSEIQRRFANLGNNPPLHEVNFYVRDSTSNYSSNRFRNFSRTEAPETANGTNHREELYSNRSAIASDHTYPRNPENLRNVLPGTDNLAPLMTSLHLTISHIQRQAFLLRQQVESIERIDRAMLEVAQLQTTRQMFGDIRRYLNNFGPHSSRSTGVSSVRQMMAGTRISDSSPYDSPTEDESSNNQSRSTQNDTSTVEDAATSSNGPLTNNAEGLRQRLTARKSFPPSRLLQMQRQSRRFSVINFTPRRYTPRHRVFRRSTYFRTLALRQQAIRFRIDFNRSVNSNRPIDDVTIFNQYSIGVMTRKLEQLLTHYIRLIGIPAEFRPIDPNSRVTGEQAITSRLNRCRIRINRMLSRINVSLLNRNNELEINNVTPDGISRYEARSGLTIVLETLAKFFDENSNVNLSQSSRSNVQTIIDLTSLLSDILLLNIVDSIPPPTGMNLDPERESLSARIDQMCSRMLQNRLSGQSYSLTRSLRLMRLTARYASRALGQTYNARRNAIFSSRTNSRRELIGQINNTLHDIQRNRISNSSTENEPRSNRMHHMPMREWYQTINALASRYNSSSSQESSSSPSNNTSTDQNSSFSERPRVNVEDGANSDADDMEAIWYQLAHERRHLYRTSNVNLLNNEGTPNRSWNVPTVQVNDVPVSFSNTWNSRMSPHRYRLAELRSNSSANLFRPRFLHPLFASGVNPFDSDVDDPQREPIYDGDMILTVTPNHRIQAWDVSSGNIPDISNSMKNLVVSECKIHNDASVDVSSDGTILVTLLPSGGYLNVTNRLGVYSLKWETLGQCLYITSFEQNAVSVSLSPLSRHLVVGLASRRTSLVPHDRWIMARIFLLNQNEKPVGSRLPVLRELEQIRDTNYMSLNCIRWLPVSGQGLIYATNTGQLRILT